MPGIKSIIPNGRSCFAIGPGVINIYKKRIFTAIAKIYPSVDILGSGGGYIKIIGSGSAQTGIAGSGGGIDNIGCSLITGLGGICRHRADTRTAFRFDDHRAAGFVKQGISLPGGIIEIDTIIIHVTGAVFFGDEFDGAIADVGYIIGIAASRIVSAREVKPERFDGDRE